MQHSSSQQQDPLQPQQVQQVKLPFVDNNDMFLFALLLEPKDLIKVFSRKKERKKKRFN